MAVSAGPKLLLLLLSLPCSLATDHDGRRLGVAVAYGEPQTAVKYALESVLLCGGDGDGERDAEMNESVYAAW